MNHRFEYRREPGQEYWHISPDCPQWPLDRSSCTVMHSNLVLQDLCPACGRGTLSPQENGGLMSSFRRRVGEKIWHWSPECTEWPGDDAARFTDDEFPENLCPMCAAAEAEL